MFAKRSTVRGDDATQLRPQVEVNCAVCGSGTRKVICSAEEIRAQLRYLDDFHRRRLRVRPQYRGDEVLADRADFTLDYATDVVSCLSCGLVFRGARPRAGAIAAAYAKDEYGRERLDQLFESQLELFRPRTRVLSHLVARRDPAIIEVGSFVGGFLAAARERGWNAIGLDPGEEVVEFCRQKGLSVVCTTAPEAPITANSADAVVIWNTFDQLPDPHPTLRAVRRWLRSDGVLALRVPNGDCFHMLLRWLRRLPAPAQRPLLAAMAWNNLLAFPYLHGYSVATLDRLLVAFDLRRIGMHPDMLTRLADAQTKSWAAVEERVFKATWRTVARTHARLAPWFDVYRLSERGVSSVPERVRI